MSFLYREHDSRGCLVVILILIFVIWYYGIPFP